eukprot:Nitzschia sp. Nitz4//scaffold40_size135432//90735//92741//NITZ4_003254-RA/size135432-snap-gene-0.131-mRNA-1//-1//CDS//3329551249//9085//frame0
MHSTKVVLGRGSVSTHHGQQRILKHSTPDLLTYIQKAVQTGIYRSNEEIEAMNKQLQDNPTDSRRIRWNVNRGSKIVDYPKEYEILSLNPPAPFRPKMPLKDQRKAMNKYIHEHRPMDRLARNYLNKQTKSGGSGEPASAEEYYHRLLGANKAPKMDSAMGAKSALVNKAYAVALKQYHIMRTENISEKEALDKVEELLKEQEMDEKMNSRAVAESFAKKEVAKEMSAEERASSVFPKKEIRRERNEDVDDSELVMQYSEQHRAFEGLISWTQRLQAVPYRQWTVGASVALDHWIAKRVLGLSEETWLALLEGDSPELLGRGRDIVMARQALFPETILDENVSALEQAEDAPEEGGDKDGMAELDEILSTLGGWGDDKDQKSSSSSASDAGADDLILKLTAELQDWRAKNMQAPYDKWSDEDKRVFNDWLHDYVEALTPESSLGTVDMEGTRNALLSSPPQTKEDSDKFWENVRDETAAEILLQQLLSAKNVEGDKSSSHPFWELDYKYQLERLVQLGAIRDIADEYASENDRAKFMARYGDYLLEGVELDHLVADPTGPIRGSDLGESLQKHYNIGPSDRFRLEKMAFGSDSFGTEASKKARDMFRAWNKFKAGRAHYEERMFKRGLLGLSYESTEKKGHN